MAQTHYTPFVAQTGQVSGTQTNFTAVIYATDNRFKYTGQGAGCHAANNNNGYDLRPYSDSNLTAALTYQLVFYSGTTGQVELWVQIPSLADGYTVYLGYGDTALNTDGSSAATWDTYWGVWNVPDGTSLSVTDGSSRANNGTNNGATSTAGQLDGAAGFGHADTSYFSAGTTGVHTAAGSQNTHEFWMYWHGAAGDVPASYTTFQNVGFFNSTSEFGVNSYNGDVTGCTLTQAGWSSVWQHLIIISPAADAPSTTNVRIYVNGVSQPITTVGTPVARTVGGSINWGKAGLGGNPFGGRLDSMKVSTGARSASYATTRYNNESNNAAFWPIGTEVAVGGGGAAGTYYGLMTLRGVQ